MGYVYAGQGLESKHFKFGRTTVGLRKRGAQHRTSDPSFAMYCSFQTTNTNAGEKFLRKRYAEWRVPNTKEWFAITREQVDEGFSALAAYMETCLSIDEAKQVKELAKQKSNGLWLKPEEDHLVICDKLRRIKVKKDILALEEDHWRDHLKLQIGSHNGIDGQCTWISQDYTRVDETLLKEKYPEVWEECRREKTRRMFFLVDDGEGEEGERMFLRGVTLPGVEPGE